MANSVGDDVKANISGPLRKAYDFATKVLGDPSKPASRKAGSSVDKNNANYKAWEEATKFHGPEKSVSKTKLAQKPPARKRAATKR